MTMTPRNYEALYKLSRSLHHLDRPFIIDKVLASISALIGVARGGLILVHNGQEIAQVAALSADQHLPREQWQTLLLRGLLGYVYHSHRTIILRNIQTDPRWLPLDGLLKSGSAIGVLLKHEAKVFGLGFFMHTQVDYFDPTRIAMLEEIAGLAAVALNNALIHEAALPPGKAHQLSAPAGNAAPPAAEDAPPDDEPAGAESGPEDDPQGSPLDGSPADGEASAAPRRPPSSVKTYRFTTPSSG